MLKNMIFAGAAAFMMTLSSASFAQTTAEVGPAATDTQNDDGDEGKWGLAGLLGLAGLFGLKRRDRPHDVRTDR